MNEPTVEKNEQKVERNRQAELSALNERKRKRESNRNFAASTSRSCFIAGSVLLSFSLILAAIIRVNWGSWLTFGKPWSDVWSVLTMILVMAAWGLTAVGFDSSARVRDIDKDIERLELQIDLISFDSGEEELKAEKLLRLNDLQLRRYYDLNLYQNRRVFKLGVSCMIAGLAIIAGSIYQLRGMKDPTDHTAQIVTAILGAVGAILTNFVAAIYLKMNTVASDTLASFHGRLVATHQLMLGNLLASRINDPTKRSETLALLALKLVDPKPDVKAAT